jgi:hypothetical protein
MNAVKKQQGTIEYFVKGDKPTLLLLSGMHGDEYETSACLADYVEKHADTLPDFLFIPKVSPSAIELKTRKNKLGHDVNRNFFDPPTDPEVKDVMNIISRHVFDLCLDFHEDPDLKDAFYVYDSDHLSEERLADFRKYIEKAGLIPHTGIDDPLDANLGLHVQDGYISTPIHSFPISAGFSFEWILTHGIAKRVFDPEVPGQSPLEVKRAIIANIFSFVLDTPLS